MRECPTCGKQWPDEASFCGDDATPLPAPGEDRGLKGKVVGHYRILEKLGGGGMGTVYLGEHLTLHRKDAIKVLNRSAATDPEALARFHREARNASNIRHPNVCAVYDFGETPDGLTFLAMEFIEGRSLSELLEDEGGTLDLARAARITRLVAEGLQAAHARGIVHRDLKPGNIMVGPDADGTEYVKVVDFGIAKAAGGLEGQEVTRMGLVAGTPEYMAPEHLAGDEPDPRSDIYSLAVVFFRLLAGGLPFRATSQSELLKKRLTEEPMSLREARPDLDFPPEIQKVLDTALAREPDQRYASAREFGEAVMGAAIPQTPATRVVEEEPAPPPPVRELPRWLPAAGAGAVVVVVATVAGISLLGGGDATEGLARIALEPAATRIAPGEAAQLTATGVDAEGRTVEEVSFTWRSADPGIAEVDGSGRLTGLAAGITTVWAVAGQDSASVAVSVLSPSPASVALNPRELRLQERQSRRLEASMLDASGDPLLDWGAPAWSSDDPAIARVDETGLVVAVSPGATMITALAGETSGSARVVVTEAGGGGGDPGRDTPVVTAADARATLSRLGRMTFQTTAPPQLRRAREEAQAIWDADPDAIPTNLRVAAAVIVGQASLALNEVGEAESWARRALALDPNNRSAQATLCSARPESCPPGGQP